MLSFLGMAYIHDTGWLVVFYDQSTAREVKGHHALPRYEKKNLYTARLLSN